MHDDGTSGTRYVMSRRTVVRAAITARATAIAGGRAVLAATTLERLAAALGSTLGLVAA